MRALVLSLVMVVPAFSVEPNQIISSTTLTPQQQQFWDEVLAAENARVAQPSPDYEAAFEHFRNARFAEALTLVNAQLLIDPHHELAQKLRDDIRACSLSLNGGTRCTWEDILRYR